MDISRHEKEESQNRKEQSMKTRERDQAWQELLEEKVGEQTDQLHDQFTELVRNMAREHALLFSLEANQHGKHSSPSLERLPAELRQPFASIEEYKEALLRILRIPK